MDWSLRAARLRWAELLRRIFEVDPLACPRGRGAAAGLEFPLSRGPELLLGGPRGVSRLLWKRLKPKPDGAVVFSNWAT